MTPEVANITYILSFLTLVADVAMVGVVLLWFLGYPPGAYLPAALTKRVLLWGALLSLGAIVLSLYYSEIVGFEPCALCWWQRVFIYPQALIFAIAFWRADYGVWRYTLPLSVFGMFFALAQWLLQTFQVSLFPCAAFGLSPCARIYFTEFGYVTFPVMAITTLALLVLSSLLARSLESVSTRID